MLKLLTTQAEIDALPPLSMVAVTWDIDDDGEMTVYRTMRVGDKTCVNDQQRSPLEITTGRCANVVRLVESASMTAHDAFNWLARNAFTLERLFNEMTMIAYTPNIDYVIYSKNTDPGSAIIDVVVVAKMLMEEK